jgi:PAS domain S-box-containing protein
MSGQVSIFIPRRDVGQERGHRMKTDDCSHTHGLARSIGVVEEALREAKERYSALFDRSLVCIYLHDFEGNFLDANQASLDLVGYTGEEMSALNFASLLSEDQLPIALQTLEEILRTGRQEKLTRYKVRKKNGDFIWVETEGSLLYRQGEPYAVQTIARDITEKRRAEESLRESERRYRLLADNATDVIFTRDMNLRVTYVSPSITALRGYTVEEVMAQTLEENMTPASSALATKVFAEELAFEASRARGGSPRSRTIEVELNCKDGSTVWTEVKMSFLRDEEDRALGILGIIRDISERKRAEEALRQYREHLEELVKERTARLEHEIAERKRVEEGIRRLNAELERRVNERTAALEKALEELKRLDEMKDSFLSSVSHELRTPLTSIRSFSEILLRYDRENPATRKEFLQIINTESERLTRLINDLLDLSRIEAGGMVWQDAPLSMREVVEDAVRAQHQLRVEKSLPLRLEISPDLPTVHADRDRIQQVLTNLLGNAIKFSPQGGEIRISGETLGGGTSGERPGWVKVSVSDQGVGVDEKHYEIIFDRFHQIPAETSRDKPKGTGLGLAICKEVVGHYGGRIWVESEPGKGSTFSFTLPTAGGSGRPADGDVTSSPPIPSGLP